MHRNYSKYSDNEIVSLLYNKKEKGIDALYNQYGRFLFRTIQQKIGQKDFAETVLQDTLLKVWLNIDSYNFQKGKLLSWLLRIARNTSIDMLRSKQYKDSLKLTNLEVLCSHKEPKTNPVKFDTIDIREFVSKKLDVKCGEVVDLIYFEGYTCKEVSQELGIPLGTVKSRSRKAYRELRGMVNCW